jgi:hypothetical protein
MLRSWYAYAGRDIYISYIHARGHSWKALAARCVHPESFTDNSLQVGDLPSRCSIDFIVRGESATYLFLNMGKACRVPQQVICCRSQKSRGGLRTRDTRYGSISKQLLWRGYLRTCIHTSMSRRAPSSPLCLRSLPRTL